MAKKVDRRPSRKEYHRKRYHEVRKHDPEYRAKASRRAVAAYRLDRYNIDAEAFAIMLEEHDGVCGICKKPPKKGLLCIDHCHKTGRVRGLLCRNCNTAIGLLEDDPGLLGDALEYLLWR